MQILILGQPITKKNHQEIRYNRKTNKPYITQSDRYLKYSEESLWQLKAQKLKQNCPKPPYNVKCVYYLAQKRRCDLTNLLQATDDLLVAAGIIEDDNYNIVASHDGSKVLFDKENPRVEVEITAKAEEKPTAVKITEDFVNILLCAERYSVTRRVACESMPKYIMSLLPNLNKRGLTVLHNDLNEAELCHIPVWDDLLCEVDKLLDTGFDGDCSGDVEITPEFTKALTLAIKYSVGRKTYMPKTVIDFTLSLLPVLPLCVLVEFYIFLLAQDEIICSDNDVINGPLWLSFRSKIREKLSSECQDLNYLLAD